MVMATYKCLNMAKICQNAIFCLPSVIQRREMHLMAWIFGRRNFAAQKLQKHRCFWISGGDPPQKNGPLFLTTGFYVFPTYKLKAGIWHSVQRYLQL